MMNKDKLTDSRYDKIPSEILEKRKIGLEIDQLKKPWYLKPGYLGLLIPSFVALVSIIVGLLTGVFDVKKEKLELDRLKLEKEIVYFQDEKDILKSTIDSLDMYVREKEEIISDIQSDYDSQVKALEDRKSQHEADLEIHKLDSEKTKNLYEDRIKTLEAEIQNLINREGGYKLSIKQKNDSIVELSSLINRMNFNGIRQQFYSNIDFNNPEINRIIQMKLSDLGYFVGPNDGIIGERTKQAILNFKIANNLENNDILDNETIVEIYMKDFLRRDHK